MAIGRQMARFFSDISALSDYDCGIFPKDKDRFCR
jgi:hypothetical protein